MGKVLMGSVALEVASVTPAKRTGIGGLATAPPQVLRFAPERAWSVYFTLMRSLLRPHGIYTPNRAHIGHTAQPTESPGNCMPDLNQLSEWASALKASLPFAMALPIFLATVFATIADWIEAYLVRQQAERDRDDGTQIEWLGHMPETPPSRAAPFALTRTIGKVPDADAR